MPELPENYTGYAVGFDFSVTQEDSDSVVSKASLNDDDNSNAWIIIVGICGVIIFAIFIGSGIYFYRQRKADH